MNYSFNSINSILEKLEKQTGWEQYQQYRRLLQGWHAVVDSKIAENARPLYIAREILWVATSSSTWAQEISFKRYQLLQKLNAQLSFQLLDLRCSPAGWHQTKNAHPFTNPLSTQQQHPSKVAINPTTSSLPTNNNSQIDIPKSNSDNQKSQQLAGSFQRWAQTMQARSQNLPLCPQCHCPTPNGELQRWGLCHYCVAQRWSEKPH